MTHPDLDVSWTVPGPGETLAANYVVEAECGRGGLAVVLSALQIEPSRRVAIKILLPEWAGDRGIVERFVREGRSAARVKSEHVVRVLDVQTSDHGVPYLVLEWVDGRSLDEVVRTWGPLPVATSVDWLLQAAEAIAEAHAQGIVHPDLKPASLFLTQRADGTACIKVADFGLSKITDPRLEIPVDPPGTAGDVARSPQCTAPEPFYLTHQADSRADLWALGVVLYELLTGKPPFAGATVPELRAAALTEPVPPLSVARGNVPPAVDQAVLRCLQKDPEARFASIAEMARALSPYGTRLARASLERIERTLGPSRGPSDFSLPPLAEPETESWPGADDGRALQTPASARVVVGSFMMLSGLFIGAFMWIYADVHAGEGPTVGATSMQPTPGAAVHLETRPALRAVAPAKVVDAKVPTTATPLPSPARTAARPAAAASLAGSQPSSVEPGAKSAPPAPPPGRAPAARGRIAGAADRARGLERSASPASAVRRGVRPAVPGPWRPAPVETVGRRATAHPHSPPAAAGGGVVPTRTPTAAEDAPADDNPYSSPADSSPPVRPAAPATENSTAGSPPADDPRPDEQM